MIPILIAKKYGSKNFVIVCMSTHHLQYCDSKINNLENNKKFNLKEWLEYFTL